MLPGLVGCVGGAPATAYTLLQMLQGLGLTTNLKLCLDAGDSASYSGSGQKWLDTSGNGHDFFRGSSGSSQSSDPTFNGVAGAKAASNYWSFDGGDFFAYDTTNETWMQNLHKDGATFSLVCWIFSKAEAAAAGESQTILSTLDSSIEDTGIWIFLAPSNGTLPGALTINVYDGGDTVLVAGSTGESLKATDDQWNFVSVAFAEGSAARYNINGSAANEAGSVTYTSPATGNASNTMTIGADGGGGLTFDNGTRLAMLAIWEGTALTAAQLQQIWDATRGRLGV